MDRAVVLTILVVLLGVWVRPFLIGADPLGSRTGASAIADSSAATADFDRQFEVLRGTPGYWRVGRTPDGIWWFISPDNKREFLNTVTTVVPYQLSRNEHGPHFVSRDYRGSLPAGEGDVTRAWAERTLERVKQAGFKGLGAWSHPIFEQLDVPMSRDLNVWTWMPESSRRLYSPDWQATAELAIRTQVEPLKNNRSIIGFFTDNELDWSDNFAGPSAYFNHLPPQDPNRLAVLETIRAIWPTVEAFNEAWELSIVDWSEVDSWQTLPQTNTAAYSRLYSAFLERVARDYFRITSELVRRHAPNHLVLGVRYKGWAPREVVRASRDHTDAQSLNYYVGDARLDFEMFRMMHEESGQPLLITEYSFHSLDGRSGNRNTVGFAAQVPDQQARAEGYRLMTTRLARVPWIIGADWFQWADEPPAGRTSDGEDVNFGVVDVDDKPYDELISAIRETAPRLNMLHRLSAKDIRSDLWRESFATKPLMLVPYLSTPITLNGELSDWPGDAELSGVRHSQTVGLDRSKYPIPRIFLGWRSEGLFLAFEVFDSDIQTAPADGWWWTRDNVEFWIATRAPAPEQDHYDHHAHQFFFVPSDARDQAARGGVVGQWHRPGDAIGSNIIPHPSVRQSLRIFADRYVVEIFVPAEALHGFDALTDAEWGFNLHIRNWQHATDYFWSAPKEVMTQHRPGTWGRLQLLPPGVRPNLETRLLPRGIRTPARTLR